MSDARLRRVNKEIKGARVIAAGIWASLTAFGGADCKADSASKIQLDLIDNSPYHLKGSFNGPEGTPYEGGHFEVVSPLPAVRPHERTVASPRSNQDIVIPDSYPFQPVKMKFITKIYHPNVSSASGAICLDILKDAWSPVLTLKSTLISLQSLLCSPEPNDPQDAEVAKHYLTSKSSFEDTARYWTQVYAGGPVRGMGASVGGRKDEIAIAGLEKAHVDQFEALGFDRNKVVRVATTSLPPFCRPLTSLHRFSRTD